MSILTLQNVKMTSSAFWTLNTFQISQNSCKVDSQYQENYNDSRNIGIWNKIVTKTEI